MAGIFNAIYAGPEECEMEIRKYKDGLSASKQHHVDNGLFLLP